jgi:CCR4-NOT transcription complex subunit 7/8
MLSTSGYDFGYLVKILTCSPLPATETEFFELLELWFPNIYDIKHIMRSCKTLKGGLQDVADSLQVRSTPAVLTSARRWPPLITDWETPLPLSKQVARIGPQHQAGSDSLLTAATFFTMRKVFFEDKIEDEFYK